MKNATTGEEITDAIELCKREALGAYGRLESAREEFDKMRPHGEPALVDLAVVVRLQIDAIEHLVNAHDRAIAELRSVRVRLGSLESVHP